MMISCFRAEVVLAAVATVGQQSEEIVSLHEAPSNVRTQGDIDASTG
ncbi:hypothetical protein [Edaphobacter albus]|nr:hypothetical protein [Edaphobacter sp. 4G125]QNI37677.1 hypothetical protein H7846_05145 [Edaphobacter sp. 4G125]